MQKRRKRRQPELESDLLTVEEAARALSVAPSTIRGYIRDGLIKGVQLPMRGMYRISKEEIDRILSGRNSCL